MIDKPSAEANKGSAVKTVLTLLSHSAAGGAPEGLTPTGLPAAESGPPGSASAEAVEPGEDSAGPGVPAP